MSLQFTKSATLPAEACCETWGRGPWGSFEISLYRVTITWQERFKVTAVDVLLHVTVECKHLWQVMQRLLIAISHGVKGNIRCENRKEILLPTSFIRCEKKHCCQRSAFLGLLQLTWVIFFVV